MDGFLPDLHWFLWDLGVVFLAGTPSTCWEISTDCELFMLNVFSSYFTYCSKSRYSDEKSTQNGYHSNRSDRFDPFC